MRRRALLAASDGESGGGSDGPITFSIYDSDGIVTKYTIPYKMTWEEFVNSDLNETKIDSMGQYYKQFTIKNYVPSYASLYDGELDSYYGIYIDGLGYVMKEHYIESRLYYAD